MKDSDRATMLYVQMTHGNLSRSRACLLCHRQLHLCVRQCSCATCPAPAGDAVAAGAEFGWGMLAKA